MTTNSSNGLSRRTVVIGAAWAVPAIVVASAAPALAASGPVVLTGRACKDPGNQGNKSYYFEVKLTNTTSSTVTYTFTQISINGETTTVTPKTVDVSSGQTKTVVLTAAGLSDSANGTAKLDYSIGTVAGSTSQYFSGFTVYQDNRGNKCPIKGPQP